MSRPAPTPEEEREWALERAAVLQCALRHVAAAWHRKHTFADVKGTYAAETTWTHCEDHFCRMAHDAVEGRYVPRTVSPHGVVISLQKKEA